MSVRPTGRAAALEVFYATHAGALERTVAHRAGTSASITEDACQTAWAILVRRPDVDLNARGLAWLAIVATREAWRLASAARDELAAGTLATGAGGLDDGELPEPISPDGDPVARALTRESYAARRRALGALKERERRELLLHAAGYSYAEIAKLTESSYTAVNRHLSEGRARLRAQNLDAPVGGENQAAGN